MTARCSYQPVLRGCKNSVLGAAVVHLRPSHVSYLDIPNPPPSLFNPFSLQHLFPSSNVDQLKHRRKLMGSTELRGKF